MRQQQQQQQHQRRRRRLPFSKRGGGGALWPGIGKRDGGGRDGGRKQHFKASFDAKKLWTTSEATRTATALARRTSTDRPAGFKAAKPVAERRPRAEQEDDE